MADPDPSRPDLLARTKQARAHSHTLREQVAEVAEAVAEVAAGRCQPSVPK
jgi:hypothetical protein